MQFGPDMLQATDVSSHLFCVHGLQALAAFHAPEEVGETETQQWKVDSSFMRSDELSYRSMAWP